MAIGTVGLLAAPGLSGVARAAAWQAGRVQGDGEVVSPGAPLRERRQDPLGAGHLFHLECEVRDGAVAPIPRAAKHQFADVHHT